MRKILYRELKKRLSRLLIADSGDIVFASEECIKQIVEAGETPDYAIKHIGLWNRQVEFIEQEEHFPLPAVFVEFGKLSWRHQTGGLQDADLTVGLHVLTTAMPEGYDGDEFHLDLLDKINRCLHGFTGEYWGAFKRSASIPCHDHEEILDDTEVFQALVYDRSSERETIKYPVPPNMAIRTK
jgi:hypothetical protein